MSPQTTASDHVIEKPSKAPSDRAHRWRWMALAAIWALVCSLYFCWLQPPYRDPREKLNAWKAWCFPKEKNATKRLPSLGLTELWFMQLQTDGMHGWGVGADGAILSTSDGGKSWIPQTSGTTNDLASAQFLADRMHGWVVGNLGTILSTSDGGKSWLTHKFSTIYDLCAVQFQTDGIHGWIVGTMGTILSTSDGGKSWTPQTSGTRQNLSSVQFLADGIHGWLVGSGGTILSTSDGGKSWTPQTSGTRANLRSIQFLADGIHGWLVGSGGTILSTSDDGKSWTPQTSGTTNDLSSVQFLADRMHGWTVGEGGTNLSTSDGGEIWIPQNSSTRKNLSSVQFLADGIHGWILVDGGTILSTSDDGKSWTPQTSGTDSWLWSVQFQVDGIHGWLVGNGGTILSTSDGGKSWIPQTSGTTNELSSVQFLADRMHGWVVGDLGTILSTSDGGKSWTPQTSGTDSWLWSVQFQVDGIHGWLVGSGGTILSTSDGGKSWIPQTSGTDNEFMSTQFHTDGMHGWTVGEMGTILSTSNSGKSWTPQTSGTTNELSSVQFLADGMHGWAVGEMGTILSTSNGGKSWSPQTSGTTNGLSSVQLLADGMHGWAVGKGGTILSTSNKGKSWNPQTSGTRRDLRSVHFLMDGIHGWSVGVAGTMLLTENGGEKWTSINAFPYHRRPAPLFYCLLGLAVVPMWLAMRKPRPTLPEGDSIADSYIFDQPLTLAEAAGTQVGALAAGLAGYLENPKTQAPLVLSVSGQWGAGKSSLMNLLAETLKIKGFQTVWFNAWHHQNEEQLFASLLASLRDRALPPWWSLRGVLVRWRLLGQRAGRLWLTLLLGLAGAVFVVSLLLRPEFGDLTQHLLQRDWTNEEIIKWLWIHLRFSPPFKIPAFLLMPLLVVWSAWKIFTAFGVDPGKLVVAMRGGSAADARTATSLRERFAEEFKEVTEALSPGTLTFFIDDLDRCHPEQMLTMLETVNFLATSGKCYVVLGMDQQVVRCCLEKQLVWLKDVPLPADAPPGTTRAQLWLEKLVQMRLRVARLSPEEMAALFESRKNRERRMTMSAENDWQRLLQWLPDILPKITKQVAVLALIGVVAWGAHWLAQTVTAVPDNPAVQATSAPTPEQVTPSPNVTSPTPDPGKHPAEAETTPSPVEVTPGETAPPNWGWMATAAVLLLLAAGRVLTLRDPKTSREDSATFTDTLKEFEPCIEAACQTPRAVKHLINRVRLYAMLLRHWTLDETNEDIEAILKTQERNLVIFGILEKLCPEQLQAAVDGDGVFALRKLKLGLEKFDQRALTAIRELKSENFKTHFKRLISALEID